MTGHYDPSLAARSEQLRAARQPFVHARVVLAEKPTSARPGDEALILDDGTIEGFVGGSCSASTVRERAIQAMHDGESVLLRITPNPESDQPGKEVVHNHCLSGGSLEIFLEPELPATMLAIIGSSPIAQALARIGAEAGFATELSDSQIPDGAAAVVVAAHGHGDEPAVLTEALRSEVSYVGLVASPKRGAGVLAAMDIDDELKQRVHTPAGFDIGARGPEEVALSILAEIIAERPTARSVDPLTASPMVEHAPGQASAPPQNGSGSAATTTTPNTPQIATAIDPVCGMTVVQDPNNLHLDHHDTVVWFCGIGCKQAFAADPASYVG